MLKKTFTTMIQNKIHLTCQLILLTRGLHGGPEIYIYMYVCVHSLLYHYCIYILGMCISITWDNYNAIHILMHSQQYDTLKIHMKQLAMRWDTIHPCYDAVRFNFNSIRFNTMRFDAMEKIWSLLFLWLFLTQVQFIDRDSVTRSSGPLLCHSSTTITSCCSMMMHGPMLQGSVHNSWKTSQFLHGQHTHQTCHLLSMFGMFWIGVYSSVFQFLPISSNFAQPLKRSGPTFHRPQSATWSTLGEGDVLHCVRQMVVTPDTDWFSDSPGPPPPPNTVKLNILEWPFIVASLRHTRAIMMLSNQHLDMPHLWGGWIISAKEKCSLTQI